MIDKNPDIIHLSGSILTEKEIESFKSLFIKWVPIMIYPKTGSIVMVQEDQLKK